MGIDWEGLLGDDCYHCMVSQGGDLDYACDYHSYREYDNEGCDDYDYDGEYYDYDDEDYYDEDCDDED